MRQLGNDVATMVKGVLAGELLTRQPSPSRGGRPRTPPSLSLGPVLCLPATLRAISFHLTGRAH